MAKTAESAFNTELGKVLRRKHPRWLDRIGVEQTGVLSESAGLKPDVIVNHPGGLPVSIETEYTPAGTVERDACQRLGKTLLQTGSRIEEALAVRIPAVLAEAPQYDLQQRIEETNLEFCVFSEGSAEPDRWPKTGWLDGSVDDLAACIELVALSENRVTQGMLVLEQGIGQAAVRLRDACADAPDTLEAIAQMLHQKDGPQTSRMAMAILANALTFHTAVAGVHGIQTLDQLRARSNGLLSKRIVLAVWQEILNNINYWPIFKIASDILMPMRDGTAQDILEKLSLVAANLDSLGATSQHDLCGQMLQRLISDRKFLATFYTLPSSAALLAELAVSRLPTNFEDDEAVVGLRISDFACGTGALLKAAYEAVLGRFRRSGGDDRDIHAKMMEHALIGADIMPAATHLTASVLSSTHPSLTFGNTSIFTLPYGRQSEDSGRPIAIGALDLIEDELTLPLFGTGRQRLRGVGESDDKHVDLPHGGFDLVIMNPPFSRSTGHEAAKRGIPAPAFAGFATSNEEMRLMSVRLKQIRKPAMVGQGNAGLASNFIDLAHAKVKTPGGVLALVLPAAFLRGQAWAATRKLFEAYYKNLVVVSIATTGATARAFSYDTGNAEVLVIATRKDDTERSSKAALFVNLRGRPKTIMEAAAVARSVQRTPDSHSVAPLIVGSEERAGCCIRDVLSNTGCSGLREAELVKAADGLVRGTFRLPRHRSSIQLPLVKLAELGNRGLYHMDINGKEVKKSGLPRGPFNVDSPIEPNQDPTWPVLWSHNALRQRRMMTMPDRAGEVRTGCGDLAVEVWRRTASCLHFNRDFRLNSQSFAACMTPELSIGGRAWPNFLCADPSWERPLVCWANTTLGLISFWWVGSRQQEGRAMLTITALPTLTVLDPRELTARQLDHANAIFDAFRDRPMLPANEAWRDETRHALDRAILIELVGLSEEVLEPLALLRRQWCAEPTVHGGKSTRPVRQP